MIQYKYIISLNQLLDRSKIGIYWHKRRTITQFKYIGNYISSSILRSNDIVTYDLGV